MCGGWQADELGNVRNVVHWSQRILSNLTYGKVSKFLPFPNASLGLRELQD